jgi:hypothetical protein
VLVKLVGHDRLTALIDVDMPHGLFARLVKAGQGLERLSAAGLGFQRLPHVCLGGLVVLAEVQH